MKDYTITILFLFLISPNHFQAAIARSCLFVDKYTIHISNELPPNSQLKLHCASKNDDLGNHTLIVGQEYTWSFCENFIPNTLFYCDATWGSKKCHFDAFSSAWNGRCSHGKCYWEAREDGFYMSSSKDTPSFYKKYADWI